MNLTLSRLSLFLVISVVCVTTAMATPACPTTTYDNYNPQNIGTLTGSITCTINSLTFSEFQFGSSGTPKPTASDISVTPQATLGNEGFVFGEDFINQDATIEFEVTAPSSTPLSDLSIFLDAGVGAGGNANFTETYCTAAFTGPSCKTFAAGTLFGSFATELNLTSPTTTLFITKDFGVSGNATFSVVGNNYSHAVPEPSQLGLLVVGVGGLFLARRKAKASAQ